MDSRRGFTLIEMVVVIMVAGILLSFSVNAFGNIRSRFAVRDARQAFTSLHARARAQAIEYGRTTEFRFDVTGDSIWVERNDTTLTRIHLQNEFGVDMTSNQSQTVYTLCMNTRGFGKTGCTDFTANLTIEFSNGDDTESLGMTPLGAIRY